MAWRPRAVRDGGAVRREGHRTFARGETTLDIDPFLTLDVEEKGELYAMKVFAKDGFFGDGQSHAAFDPMVRDVPVTARSVALA